VNDHGMTLDPAGLARLLEITGDDLEFVDELVDTFFDDSQVQLAALRTAAEAADIEALIRPAHSLKSSSGNVGAVALSELCRLIEVDARAGSVTDAPGRVRAVEAEFAAARDALLAEREVADNGAANARMSTTPQEAD